MGSAVKGPEKTAATPPRALQTKGTSVEIPHSSLCADEGKKIKLALHLIIYQAVHSGFVSVRGDLICNFIFPINFSSQFDFDSFSPGSLSNARRTV